MVSGEWFLQPLGELADKYVQGQNVQDPRVPACYSSYACCLQCVINCSACCTAIARVLALVSVAMEAIEISKVAVEAESRIQGGGTFLYDVYRRRKLVSTPIMTDCWFRCWDEDFAD